MDFPSEHGGTASSKNDSSRSSSEWLTMRSGMLDRWFQSPPTEGRAFFAKHLHQAPGEALRETFPIIFGQMEGWKVMFLI